MKDNLCFVDSDMHVMEPPDLFERYRDAKYRDRVTVQIGGDGRPRRGAAGLILLGAERMCISTDYPHFDSNYPNSSNNLLKNCTRKTPRLSSPAEHSCMSSPKPTFARPRWRHDECDSPL